MAEYSLNTTYSTRPVELMATPNLCDTSARVDIQIKINQKIGSYGLQSILGRTDRELYINPDSHPPKSFTVL